MTWHYVGHEPFLLLPPPARAAGPVGMHALLRGAVHLSRCCYLAPLSVRAAAEPTQESSRKRRTKWSVSVAAGALIDSQGRLLLVQRAAGDRHALKYEFPGGKVEQGEARTALDPSLCCFDAAHRSRCDSRPWKLWCASCAKSWASR